MSLTIELIRERTAASDYELSLHADEERLAETLTIAQLEEVLQSAELLEDYPSDPRGPSCLVLGYVDGSPVHVVCGRTKQGRLIVITVYRPKMPKWLDERRRAPKE